MCSGNPCGFGHFWTAFCRRGRTGGLRLAGMPCFLRRRDWPRALRAPLSLVTVAVLAGLASLPRARASELEPNGQTVPQLPSSSELTAAAAAMSEVHLDRLIISRSEMLESQLDAHAAPAGFFPLCNITAQLVLRGGTCAVDLGWYNVLPMQALPPPPEQIYSLVPAPDPVTMPRPSYTPGVGVQNPIATLAMIRKDSRYLGGLIGFAMMGNDKNSPAVCTQTHFTTPAFNAACSLPACMNQPWLTGLMYQSTAMKDAYYFLFEELPTTPADFGNDGDFNDQVFLVTGVTCDGGEQPCDTGKPGVCKAGTTQCGKMGALSCVANLAPSADVCDGLDNDCDGVVDPDPTACANPAQLCDRGRCVDRCDDATNPCRAGLVCEAGLCKTTACAGVVCPAGQRCVQGACQDGCSLSGLDVTCPDHQVCRAGRCVDPCAGVTCAAGLQCDDGQCLPPCWCRACAAGQSCGLDGTCVDQGCRNTTCGAGMFCARGICRDPCYLALCPDTEYCSMGQCLPAPLSTPTGGAAGLPGLGSGGAGGMPGQPGQDAAAGADGADAGSAPGSISSCACRVAGSPPPFTSALALLGASLLLRRRRR